MNIVLQLVFSTFLILELGVNASMIPFHKLTADSGRNRRTLSKQIFSNYVDEDKLKTKEEGLKSHTCAYYNYKDECHNSNEGCSVKTETCTYKTSNPGCYTLWNKDHIILQGCWAPSAKEECTPGDCISKQAHVFRKLVLHFCCCYGNSCNKKFGLSNHLPRWS